MSLNENCVVCGANVTSHKKSGDFLIVRCSQCGLLHARAETAAPDLENFYQESYYHAEAGDKSGYFDYLGNEKNLRKNADNIFKIAEKYKALNGLKALDIGCAQGFLLSELRDKYKCDVHGVELSQYSANYAKEKFNLDVRTGILDGSQFAPETFDVVFIIGTIEHLSDPVAVTKAAFSVLKKGGLFIITTIDTSGYFPLYSIKPPEHLFYFDHSNLNLMLEKAGFHNVLTKTYFTRYLLHDLFERLYAFFRFPPFQWCSRLTRKVAPNFSVKIPTNEMIMIAGKR